LLKRWKIVDDRRYERGCVGRKREGEGWKAGGEVFVAPPKAVAVASGTAD
jgi:hypothetical protein